MKPPIAASLAAFALSAAMPLPSLVAAEPTPSDVTVTINDQTMTAMKSPWADYFGTHYASSPEGAGKAWNTVRSYGGTHVGIAAENPDAPPRKGPFTGREVRFTLEDFHGARGGKSAAQLIPELIDARLTGIYIMTSVVRPTLQPFDQDRAYWAVRQIHEKFPDAHRHVVWQMGNEVVSGHFDPKEVWNPPGGAAKGKPQAKGKQQEKGKRQAQEPRASQKEDNFFGYDLKWKEDYYVNQYLAPAIEATERASQDVYGDPRKIRIALGSMNPYNPQNIEFLANVMGRTFDGRHAPDHRDLAAVSRRLPENGEDQRHLAHRGPRPRRERPGDDSGARTALHGLGRQEQPQRRANAAVLVG
jgi:hypothetical protein